MAPAPTFHQHPAVSAANPMAGLPGAHQAALMSSQTSPGLPAAVRPGMNPYFPPMLYWYPSPPVSPQSSYYVHANPTTVILKGLPLTITAQELLVFFDGVFEVSA